MTESGTEMRVVVVYDPAGNIKSMATAPEGGALPGMALAPGEELGTIDVPDLPHDLDPEETNKRLTAIAERHIVEPNDTRMRLRVKE
ncbi:hypothetical protein ABZU32_00480 [Sphaerisporangium sp. NPDC005288]|uniref:hypothetical protein n=1 Tax=unclassified Sphaerisporangium TaxID=2630420 RepID=UPI0033B19AD8